MRRWLCLLLLVVSFAPWAAIAWQARAMDHLGRLSDDGVYAVTARALAEGRGYRLEHLPGAPAQTKYPPLYPLYLSLFWRLGPGWPGSLSWMLAGQVLLLPIFGGLCWKWFRVTGFQPVPAALLAAAVVLNPYSVYFGAVLVSELLFSCLLLATVLLAARASTNPRPTLWLTVGLTAGLAWLTRSAALPLLPVLAFLSWRRGGWRSAALVAAAIFPAIAGWEAWCLLYRTPTSDPAALYYTDYFGFYSGHLLLTDLPAILYKNLTLLLNGLSGLLAFAPPFTGLFAQFLRLLGLAAIAGCVRTVREKGFDALTLYGAAYCLLLAVWNFPPNERLLYPLLPLVISGFAAEFGALGRLLRAALHSGTVAERAVASALATAAVALIITAAVRQTGALLSEVPAQVAPSGTRQAGRETLAWIRANTPAGTRILNGSEGALYWATGRRGYAMHVPTRFDYRGDPAAHVGWFQDAASFARQNRLEYLMFGPNDVNDLTPAATAAVRRGLRADPALQLAYRNGPYEVFRLAR